MAATQGVRVEESTLSGSEFFFRQNLVQILGGEDHVRRSNDELAATRQRPVLPPAGFKGHWLVAQFTEMEMSESWPGGGGGEPVMGGI